jgi:hypothetical protein
VLLQLDRAAHLSSPLCHPQHLTYYAVTILRLRKNCGVWKKFKRERVGDHLSWGLSASCGNINSLCGPGASILSHINLNLDLVQAHGCPYGRAHSSTHVVLPSLGKATLCFLPNIVSLGLCLLTDLQTRLWYRCVIFRIRAWVGKWSTFRNSALIIILSPSCCVSSSS